MFYLEGGNNLFTGVTGYSSALNFTKGNLAATAYRTRKTDSLNFKYYRYDVRGRVIKMWNIVSGFDTLVTDYSYNSQDQMTSYTHTKDDDDKTFKNTYDYAGRLMKADYYIGPPDMPNPDQKNLSEYDYNANSQVLEQRLNEGSLKNDYFFNNRNWIIEMLQSQDLFSYTNGYYKNGNVKTQQLSGTYNDNFASSTDLSFTYSYDRSNRLTASNTSSKNYELFNTYDNDGNILTLDRFGSGSQTDDFNYVYYSLTNKLQRVSGAGNQFSYDANGNLIQDALNNNNEMLYDHRNLITELKHRSMIIDDTVYLTKYYYDEAGSRIRKMTYAYLGKLSEGEPPANSDVSNTSDWSIRNDEVYSRDVSGREVAIYKNASILEYPFYGLDMIGKLKNDELHFYLKDHLGSVRAVVQDDKILSSQDYDAWGYILEGRTYQSEEGKFKFTGKERDEESFYDYFGARYYDARVGRWGQVEPLLDKYPQISPYVYSLDNPLIVIDKNGMDPRRDQIVTYTEIINVFENNMYKPIGAVVYFNFIGDNHKYLLTQNAGIIDMLHFIAGGVYTSQSKVLLGNYESFEMIVQLGEMVEEIQNLIGDPSGYAPEDPRSNLEGVLFGLKLSPENSIIVTEGFISSLRSYLEDLKPLSPDDPSISRDKVYIPEDGNAETLPRRSPDNWNKYIGEDLKK
jgi:RHS repeat-associated protein